MSVVRASGMAGGPPTAGPCACQSPVCPMEHSGEPFAPDQGVIGLAVGVRRVVVMPVPRLRRGGASPSFQRPWRLSLHLPLGVRRARA